MKQEPELDSSHLLQFIYSKRKTFLILGMASTILSSVFALLMEEQFRSSVILFATPQHSIGEQFYEEVKRNDLLEYGETEDAERLLQILNSDRIRSRVIEKYNLWDHYEIDPSTAGARSALMEEYSSNVDANLTRYGSIEVSVLDADPQVAANIANDIAFLADSVANQLRNERARAALKYAASSFQQVQDEIGEMEVKISVLHGLGLYEFETQIGGLNEQYATAMAEGNLRNAQLIKEQMAELSQHATEFSKLTSLIEAAYEREAVLKKRYELMKLDAETQLASAFIVDYAAPADKKAKPIRWLIVAVSVLSTCAFALLLLLAIENIQRSQAA
jgi:uncharacterized protein involved in exopolysaccharide biosynthesis